MQMDAGVFNSMQKDAEFLILYKWMLSFLLQCKLMLSF